MKLSLLLIGVFALTLSPLRAQSRRELLLDEIIAEQNALAVARVTQTPVFVNPYATVVPAAIYSAYPNNPALYRYLNNNPRMIPYYLGQ